MLKRIAMILLVVLSLCFWGGTAAQAAGGFNSYADNTDGYRFFYPNGWVQVRVKEGPDVVFHDFIEPTENVSVVISPVSGGKTLADLGTPSEVGYKLSKSALAPPGSGREAELVNAAARELKGKTYYNLEYAITLPNQKRHNLASVVINRGKLLTFNVSTTEKRWQRVQQKFKQVIDSFVVY